ncbi:MAG TPA: hypothetical protein VEC12_14930 [Bacteroidia bacterium]|nr:hypothetical protein [Bacteroidia bacterium]
MLATTTCKKEDGPKDPCNCPEDADCFDFPEDKKPVGSNWGGVDVTSGPTQDTRPFFNPNNPDEIVYVRAYYYNAHELIVYNLKTKEKRTIYTGIIASPPRWSVKDWIIFWGPESRIWKVRADGTGLTKFASDYANYNPEWSPDGTKFCFEMVIDTVIDGRYANFAIGAIADENGNLLERLDYTRRIGVGPGTSWGKNNYITQLPTEDGIRIYEPDSNIIKEYKWSFCSKLNFGGGGTCWVDDNTLIWSNQKGVFRADLAVGTTTCIAKSCDSKKFGIGSGSYSKHSKKIIGACSITGMPAAKAVTSTVLFMMNLDGSGKEFINIP